MKMFQLKIICQPKNLKKGEEDNVKTHRINHHRTPQGETGVITLKAKKRQGFLATARAGKRQGRTLPYRRRGGPTTTSVLAFWPPEL